MNTLNLNLVSTLENISNMNAATRALYKFLLGNKGRIFTEADFLEKVKYEGMPKSYGPALKKLVELGFVSKENEGGYKMPLLNIEDLAPDRQLGIGKKTHTTKTENGNVIFFSNERVMYETHPGSWQRKMNILVWMGYVRAYHINEDGFVYAKVREDAPTGKTLELLKAEVFDKKTVKPIGKDGKGEEKDVWKKFSQLQLLEPELPKVVKKVVTYKKAKGASLTPWITPIPAFEGTFLTMLASRWSAESVQALPIAEEVAKKAKIAFHVVDADENPEFALTLETRIVPTLAFVKNGKIVAKLAGLGDYKSAGERMYKFVKKALGEKVASVVTKAAKVEKESLN
jgi:Thioredoxin